MQVEETRPRERPNETSLNCVEQDLAKIHALEEDALHRKKWESSNV